MGELNPKWLAKSDQVLQYLKNNFDPERWTSTIRLISAHPGFDEQQKEDVVRLAQAGLLYLMSELEPGTE